MKDNECHLICIVLLNYSFFIFKDNYLREELGRLRKESNFAQDKIRELKKSVRICYNL